MDILIIVLLVFFIIIYFIGGGTITRNQGFIIERIDELKREIEELNKNKDE